MYGQCSGIRNYIIFNLINVYSAPNFVTSVGWNLHEFQTPFVWNGVDNIVMVLTSVDNKCVLLLLIFKCLQLTTCFSKLIHDANTQVIYV